VRRDYESNSPIVTVRSEDFESQTGLNIESYLNQMPQYNPASSPVTTDGDLQITPINSVGTATISLRGFGPNRSLVLVNGKRMVPSNPLMVTDINGIPSALIERTETITGGASAVYGADAVSGVTNFILKDDFEGLDLDLQSGVTAEGDGEESRLSAVMGTNFIDGRGNVTIGFETYRREAALDRDHKIQRDWWARPDSAGGLFINGVNGYNSGPANFPNPATVTALFADRLAGSSVFNPVGNQNVARGFSFDGNGGLWVNSRGGLYRANGTPRYAPDGQEYVLADAIDANVPTTAQPVNYQNLKWNNQDAYTSAPQDRYSFFASGKFDMTDTVRAFARATFAESDTSTVSTPTVPIFGWEGTVGYNPTVDSPVNPAVDWRVPANVAAYLANPTNPAFANPSFIGTGSPGAQHPVPAQLAILLNSRAPTTYCARGTMLPPPFATLPCSSVGTNTTATDNAALVGTTGPQDRWQPQWFAGDSLAERDTNNVNEVWQVEAGLEFDIGQEWTGEFYVAHGESSSYNQAGGNLSLERYRELIDRPDYGRGASISGNEPPNSARPFFGAGDVSCTSGLYDTFFRGDVAPSQDCVDAISATLQTRTQNEQNIVELNFQGPVLELPAGEVRAAAGYQSRRNSGLFNPDILQSQRSFTDQVIGVYPTGYLDAETSVDDYFFEGLIPVLSGKRGAERLELEIGARYSDYEHTDAENTWKLMVNWQVNDVLRFRGGVNRATRAPNLGELFLNPQEIFTVGSSLFGDACGLRSNSPYGAGGSGLDPVVSGTEDPSGVTPLASGQTVTGARSTRLICEAMMGGAGSPAANRFYNVDNAVGAAAGPFNWVLQSGNPNLKSETADTFTWGLVTNLGDNTTLSFDWYKIELSDAIMLYSLTYAGHLCFGTNIVSTAAAAATQAGSTACQLLPRDLGNGAPLTASLSYDNQATIKTSGMDIALNWNRSIGGAGNLGINMQATVLDYYRTKTSPLSIDVETDWKGSLGPTTVLSGTNPGAYDYRLFGSINYSLNDWNVALRWRYLPPVVTANYALEQALIENNASVRAGGPGTELSYTPTTEYESNDYSIFDLSFGWKITDALSFRGGITNLFDTDPEVVGATTGYPIGTTLSGASGVCAGVGSPPGCVNPTAFSRATSGSYNAGYYDIMGRRFFVGLSMQF
jgi:iron complex outermembrane receptor protein